MVDWWRWTGGGGLAVVDWWRCTGGGDGNGNGVCVCVGVLLPYEEGTFAAEMFLLLITAIAAAIQIRLGQFLITY